MRCKPGQGGVCGPPPAGGCCGSHPSLREKAQPRAGHGDGVALRTPTTQLTLIDGEQRGHHRSKDGIADIVTAGVDLRDHLQGAGALRHRHSPLRLAAGKAGNMAWPGATSTPHPARPHSQEGDTGTARWQHLHCHGPTAVVPMAVHHLDLQPECLQDSMGRPWDSLEWQQGQGWEGDGDGDRDRDKDSNRDRDRNRDGMRTGTGTETGKGDRGDGLEQKRG